MNRRVWQIASIAITCALVAFIFAHSIASAADSGEESMGVYAFVQSIFGAFGVKFPMSHNAFRKLAHFAEYSALGFMLIVTTRTFTPKVIKEIAKPLFLGILIPVIDETIQLTSPGRAGMIQDVWIDFSGVLVGGLFAIMLLTIIKKIKTR